MLNRLKERIRGYIYHTIKSAYLDALKEHTVASPPRKVDIVASVHEAFNKYVPHENSFFNNPHFWNRINAAQEAAQFIRENNKDAIIFRDNRSAAIKYSLSLITVDGLIIECGVFKGRSINLIAQHLPEKTIYGFDSFEGLPENWTGWKDHQKGALATPLPQVKDNVVLIKGWFDDTLPKFHQEQPMEAIGLLHIDCDLYSSTVTILETLVTRIVPGTVIVFDEYLNFVTWREHEAKAFAEFCEKYKVKFRFKAYGFFQAVVVIDEISNTDIF